MTQSQSDQKWLAYTNWNHDNGMWVDGSQYYSNNLIPALSDRPYRLDTAPPPNGYATQHKDWNSFAQAAPNRDIANKEVRPDVYVTVHKMISPVALGRFREPRPAEPEPTRTWDQGPKPKEKPEPEFKLKKEEEPDEEKLKAKRVADAKENAEKAKAEKKEKDEADAKPDEDAASATPTPKKEKEETKE